MCAERVSPAQQHIPVLQALVSSTLFPDRRSCYSRQLDRSCKMQRSLLCDLSTLFLSSLVVLRQCANAPIDKARDKGSEATKARFFRVSRICTSKLQTACSDGVPTYQQDAVVDGRVCGCFGVVWRCSLIRAGAQEEGKNAAALSTALSRVQKPFSEEKTAPRLRDGGPRRSDRSRTAESRRKRRRMGEEKTEESEDLGRETA
jgi:hypothetical protein